MIDSFTNSCLSCFRRCPREFDLRYNKQLERADNDREVLRVGSCWHKAHDAASKVDSGTMTSTSTGDAAGFAAIDDHAPGGLWKEKLRRLFAAYRWRYANQDLNIIESEKTFEYSLEGTIRKGQMDGVIEIGGQIGVLEYKTSSEDLADGSVFWSRLRMASQPSFYATAFREITGETPAFVLYDVTRKPTIRPKAITKKDAARMRADIKAHGVTSYFAEPFESEEVEAAIFDGRETLSMYGARLTADIGDRPDWYFQRNPIYRTSLDLALAEEDTRQTIQMIENRPSHEGYSSGPFPRNPDACTTFGVCDYFSLCSNDEYPNGDTLPDGFTRREHLHPELEENTNE